MGEAQISRAVNLEAQTPKLKNDVYDKTGESRVVLPPIRFVIESVVGMGAHHCSQVNITIIAAYLKLPFC